MKTEAIPGFQEFPFSHADITRTVYWTGNGAPVLVMHELPGLSPSVAGFGKRLADAGFCVYLPLLFGKPLQHELRGSYRQLCVSREFAKLQAGVSAPITDWLRALATNLSARHGGSKVGAIGMCLTGAFAIPLILEPCVTAPVAAQPGAPFSVPFRALGIGRGQWMSQLNISDDDLQHAADRARAEGLTLLTFRFSTDRVCPAERVQRLQKTFGAQLESHELQSNSVWRTLVSPPHATLTEEYDRAPNRGDDPTRMIFERVVAFLRGRI